MREELDEMDLDLDQMIMHGEDLQEPQQELPQTHPDQQDLSVKLIAIWNAENGKCKLFQSDEAVRWLAQHCGLDLANAKTLVQQGVEYTYWYIALWEQNTQMQHPIGTVDYLIPVGGMHLTMNVYMRQEDADLELVNVGKNQQLDLSLEFK